MAHAAITERKDPGSEDTAFEVICPECGPVGSADEEWLADLVGRLHAGLYEMAEAGQ